MKKSKLEWLQLIVLVVGFLTILASLFAEDIIIPIDDEPEEEIVDWS